MKRFRKVVGVAVAVGVFMGLFPETSQVLLLVTLFVVAAGDVPTDSAEAAGQGNYA